MRIINRGAFLLFDNELAVLASTGATSVVLATPTRPVPTTGRAFSTISLIDPVVESRPWAGAIRDMLDSAEAMEIDERL